MYSRRIRCQMSDPRARWRLRNCLGITDHRWQFYIIQYWYDFGFVKSRSILISDVLPYQRLFPKEPEYSNESAVAIDFPRSICKWYVSRWHCIRTGISDSMVSFVRIWEDRDSDVVIAIVVVHVVKMNWRRRLVLSLLAGWDPSIVCRTCRRRRP